MKRKMLKVQQLKKMPPGHIFAGGVTTDDPDGINIWNTSREIHWVAVRGEGFHDFAIYMRSWWNNNIGVDAVSISTEGDKCPKSYVRNILQCDDEAFELYRE